jgi:hypothetical protein
VRVGVRWRATFPHVFLGSSLKRGLRLAGDDVGERFLKRKGEHFGLELVDQPFDRCRTSKAFQLGVLDLSQAGPAERVVDWPFEAARYDQFDLALHANHDAHLFCYG